MVEAAKRRYAMVYFVAVTLLYLNNAVAWTGAVPKNSWITNLLLVGILVLFAIVGYQEAAPRIRTLLTPFE